LLSAVVGVLAGPCRVALHVGKFKRVQTVDPATDRVRIRVNDKSPTTKQRSHLT